MKASIAFVIILISVCMILRADANGPRLAPFEIPKNLIKGMRFRLVCLSHTRKGPLSFKWYKDETAIFSDVDREIVQTKRWISTLKFKSLSEKDVGRYRCEVSSSEGKTSIEQNLQINVPPFWIEEPHDITLEEGEPLKLPCHAGGIPAPEYKWSKGNQVLTSGSYGPTADGALRMDAVKDIDGGVFLCEVSNGIDRVAKQVIVRVSSGPRVKVERSVIYVERGGTATLKCSATGDYPTSIQWIRNGQILPKKSADKETSIQNKDEQTSTNLVLKDVHVEDAGRYICVVKNTLGESQAEVQLVVGESPEVPERFQVSETWSRYIHINWISSKRTAVTGYDVLYWSHRDSSKLNISVPGSLTAATIQNLHPATEYQLHIVSQNKFGRSRPSPTITVRTKDEAPSEPPSNVQVVSTGRNNAVISWMPPPESGWNSKSLTGYLVGFKATHPAVNGSYSFRAVDANRTTYTLEGLMKDTRYSIVVKAANAVGHSPESRDLSFQTEGGEDSKPQLHLKAVDGQSVTVRWSLALSEVTSYIIYSRQRGQTLWEQMLIDNPKQDTHEMKELHLGNWYEIYIMAVTKFGKSQPSNIVSVFLPDSNKIAQTNYGGRRYFASGHMIETIIPFLCLVLVLVLFGLFVTGIYICVRKARPNIPPPVNRDQDFW